jgi:predicted nucleic acid-binding protein
MSSRDKFVVKHTNRPFVGLDSQCLSYLLDAIVEINEPTDSLAEEKKALLRAWFYNPGTYILTETVISEVSAIRNIDRREFHESFVSTLFLDYPVRDLAFVQARAAQFEIYHSAPNDCRILAEAEELTLDFLLTYDHDFWKRLSSNLGTTKLMKPSAYWTNLGITKGTTPVTVPHHTNPLREQTWWRW